MKKSGIYKVNFYGQEAEYKSFCPTALQNLEFETFDSYTTDLLAKVNYQLGILNELSKNIRGTDQFLSSYIRKEALYSSQIEGTQATLDDIYSIENEKMLDLDVEEVINYVKAIKYAIKLLDELPICSRYIKNVHRILMNGVRGENKELGEFRKSQNWIGAANSSLKDAKYIPPNIDDMNKCMADLEEYINSSDDGLDILVKASLIHYQFETIHPFLDGNGRIGRMLIVLFLITKNKLSKPCLYISYFLKKNQLEYYDRMSYVRNKNDYNQWINFFLETMHNAILSSIKSLKELTGLRQRNSLLIKERDYWLLDFLENNPIIDARSASQRLGMDYLKVNRAVHRFVDLKILTIVNKSKKRRLYIYNDYMKILKTED